MRRVAKFFMFALCAAAFVFLFSFFVMKLWNWLMPDVFGLHMITYWQALGILVLAKILFGSCGPRGRGWHGGGWRHRMRERWEKMSPEERERFARGMRGCGPFAGPRSETS